LIQRTNRLIVIPCTYLLVLVGWVFFKANSTSQAWSWLASMTDLTSFTPAQLNQIPASEAAFIGITQLACWLWPRELRLIPASITLRGATAVAMFLASTVVILGKEVSPFLYYQF